MAMSRLQRGTPGPFLQQRAPEAGSDSVGRGPQTESSWASGAAPGGGNSRGPSGQQGSRLRSQTLGLCRREGGGPMGHISRLPHPSGHPIRLGWGR